jgi:flagellar biogenesis protein FliO
MISSDWLGTMGLLALVVIGLFLLNRWIKRGRNPLRGKEASLQVLERRQLSAKTTIYLVSVRGKGLVVAESSHGVRALGEVELAESPSRIPQEAASLADC